MINEEEQKKFIAEMKEEAEEIKKNPRKKTRPKTPNEPQEFQSPIASADIHEQNEQEKSPAHKKVSSKTTQKKFEVIDLVTSFDTNIEISPQDFIGGIFPRGYLSIIGGAPGVGKTWLVTRFIGDLSCGGIIANGICLNEPPRKCLVLAGELGKKGMIIRAQQANITVNKDNAFIIDQLEADSKDINITLDKGQENIIKLIEYCKPDALFVDSVIGFFDGDENKSTEIKNAFKFMIKIARDYNIAVIATHHIRKRLSNEQDKPLVLDDVIGSSVINRLTGVVIGVEFIKSSNAIMVTCLKSWFKRFSRFSYTIKSDFYGQGVIMEIDTKPQEENTSELSKDSGKTSTNNTKSATQDMKPFIKIFLKGRGKEGATLKEIESSLGKETEINYRLLLSRMYESGEIIRIKRGVYSLPENEIPAKNYEGEQLDFSDETDENKI